MSRAAVDRLKQTVAAARSVWGEGRWRSHDWINGLTYGDMSDIVEVLEAAYDLRDQEAGHCAENQRLLRLVDTVDKLFE